MSPAQPAQTPLPLRVAAPRVTVVIPCFNGAGMVGRAIDSALSQRGVDVHVIAVDDGSTDRSAELIAALVESESRLSLIRLTRNSGPAHARNVGMTQCGTRYLAFLDHDDYWRPGKLARQVEVLERTGAALAFTAVEVQNEAGHALGLRRVPASVRAEDLLVHNVIAASSVLIDRSRTPSFRMPPLRRRQDLATWYRLLRNGVQAVGVDEPLTVYTKRVDSLSANKLVAAGANWHLYRQHLGRPLPDAMSLFARYAAAAVMRV